MVSPSSVVLDIVSAMPLRFFKHFAYNIISSGRLLVMSAGVLAPLTLPAIFESFISMKPKNLLIIFGLLTFFVTLVSQAFVLDQVFLSWAVIMTVLSLMFLLKFADLCQKRYPFLERCRFTGLVIASLSVAGLAWTSSRTVSYINDKSANGELADKDSVTRSIREHDPKIEIKYIMAIHPARSYYTGAKYLKIPLYYEGTLEGLVSYEGLSERVKTYTQSIHLLWRVLA